MSKGPLSYLFSMMLAVATLLVATSGMATTSIAHMLCAAGNLGAIWAR